MVKQLFSILRLLRPRQWIKNLALFAAVTFTGQLFNIDIVLPVILGFFVFCGISSGTYIINDIIDVKKDKLHPFKKYRPLPKGDISIPFAAALAFIIVTFSLTLALVVNVPFFLLTVIYLLLQISYSTILKSIAVIDILAIAAGYILRVYGGEFASGYHISVWLLLTTISISLFLAIGKRRSELTLLSAVKAENISSVRKTLSNYSDNLLNVYASIFATSTFISYSLFTFLENPRGINLSFFDDVVLFNDPTLFHKKWLMITIIPVVYGLMRYLQDIYEKNEGESPEKVLFSDKPLLITIVVWVAMVIGIIYFVGS
jgi:decaprenyl-phosphate phosphoribosyltransferase